MKRQLQNCEADDLEYGAKLASDNVLVQSSALASVWLLRTTSPVANFKQYLSLWQHVRNYNIPTATENF